MSDCITLCFQIPVSDLTVKQLFYTQYNNSPLSFFTESCFHLNTALPKINTIFEQASFIRSDCSYTLVQFMNTSSKKKRTSSPYFALLNYV